MSMCGQCYRIVDQLHFVPLTMNFVDKANYYNVENNQFHFAPQDRLKYLCFNLCKFIVCRIVHDKNLFSSGNDETTRLFQDA